MKVLNRQIRVPDIKRMQEMWPKDWTLRFISLTMAMVLWYFVGGDDTVNKSVMVPVEVINLPRDLVISNQFKREVEVTVSGPRSQVLNMEKNELARQVDLAQAVPGTMVIKNENHMISVPRGVKVLRIQPDTIIFSLDKLIQKQFAIKPVIKGNPASHFDLQEVVMKPETISVTGPQTALGQLTDLPTREIDISGMNQSMQLQIPLNLSPVLLELIGETSVTAELVFVEETVEKRISGLPVEVHNHGGTRRLSPSTVTVVAELPRSVARENKDLRTLFKAVAAEEKENGQLSVKVVPLEKGSVIKVLKVDPSVVTFIDEAAEGATPAGKDEATKKE